MSDWFWSRYYGPLPPFVWLFLLVLATSFPCAIFFSRNKPCPPLTEQVCHQTWRVQATVEANGMPGTMLLPDESCECRGLGK